MATVEVEYKGWAGHPENPYVCIKCRLGFMFTPYSMGYIWEGGPFEVIGFACPYCQTQYRAMRKENREEDY